LIESFKLWRSSDSAPVASALELARHLVPAFRKSPLVAERLRLARDLRAGEIMSFDGHIFNEAVLQRLAAENIINLEVSYSKEENSYQHVLDNWAEQEDLLKRAAAGDAAAAFEYCRREQAGENHHGALG
jgi:hypothetical protein